MKKDIKDYLHLYLGCEWTVTDPNGMYYDTGKGMGHAHEGEGFIFKLDNVIEFNRAVRYGIGGNMLPWMIYLTTKCKPILRPLSDMTKEEANFLDAMAKAQKDGQVKPANCEFVTGIRTTSAEALRVLLSKGFDLFNLIPEGLAIDKADLTVKTLHP